MIFLDFLGEKWYNIFNKKSRRVLVKEVGPMEVFWLLALFIWALIKTWPRD